MASADSHEFILYGGKQRVVFAILDADGDPVTGAASLDSEISKDQGTFADCTNEATEIATSSGHYYLDLTPTELTCLSALVQVKTSTTGAKTTSVYLYPKRLPVLRSGTAQAGGATTIRLDSGASAVDDYYVGLLVRCSNDTPSGVSGQWARILQYNGSTKDATVDRTWGTNPSSSTTFEILVPETVNIAAWLHSEPADPSMDGVPEVDVTYWKGAAAAAVDTAGYPKVTIKSGTGTGELDLASGRAKITEAQVDQIVDEVADEPLAGHATAGTVGEALGRLDATISSRATPAQVNLEVVDALSTDTYAEPSVVPAATATLAAKIGWLVMLARNTLTFNRTTGQQAVRNSADSGDVATSQVTDDGTTTTRGGWS
jgi:hypothetical protein